MSRSLKPLSVEQMHDQRTRTTVEIMFDRNDKVFFGVVEHARISAPAIGELRDAVKAALAKLQKVAWSRVIELSVSKSDHNKWGQSGHIARLQVELDVSFSRFEVGKTSAGLYLKRPFTEDLHDSWRDSVENDPLRYSSTDFDGNPKKGDKVNRIPYSEATWVALNGVKTAIEAAYEKLEPLFDAKDGGKKLLALTDVRLLPASTDVVDAVPAKKGARR